MAAVIDTDDTRQHALEELQTRRYDVLTETVEGFADVLESTAGRLDAELFALFAAWSAHDPEAVARAVDALGRAWDTQADAMATEWARDEEDDRWRVSLMTGGRWVDEDED